MEELAGPLNTCDVCDYGCIYVVLFRSTIWKSWLVPWTRVMCVTTSLPAPTSWPSTGRWRRRHLILSVMLFCFKPHTLIHFKKYWHLLPPPLLILGTSRCNSGETAQTIIKAKSRVVYPLSTYIELEPGSKILAQFGIFFIRSRIPGYVVNFEKMLKIVFEEIFSFFKELPMV